MTNAFADLDGAFAPISGEKLMALNPRAIVVAYGSDEQQSRQALASLPGAAQLDAVKNNRVILIDDVYLTARPAEALQILHDKLKAFD